MGYETLQDIVVLFGLALLTVGIFQRFRLPSIVGFLATGVVAGPHALGLIKGSEHVEHMAEVGVVLLLFTIGIEFSLKELMRIRKLVFLGGGLQLGFTIAAITALGGIFHISPPQSLFFGFLTALSSTAILLKLLSDAGETDTPHGKTILAILIFQDLCVVPLMLLTPLLAGGGVAVADVTMISLKAAAVVLAAHYGARFMVPWILEQVVRGRSRELFILTVIFIGMGTAWLTARAGLSLALGAFIAGLAISESEYSHQAISEIIPLREAFMSLFFISVGMLLDPSVILEKRMALLWLVPAIIGIKLLMTTGASLCLGLPLRTAMVSGFALAQVGEFSFVLSQSGVDNGLLSPEAYQLFLASSIATMGLTPLCLKIADPLADRAVSIIPRSWGRDNGLLTESDGKQPLAGHVIIVGYGLNGRNLARILEHLLITHLIIETNPFTVTAEKKKGKEIIFGDASMPEVLHNAGVERARIMVIAISDAAAARRITTLARRLNPVIHLIVRTRYVQEVEPLYKLGANEVIPEEFETSVEILSRVLKSFLVPQDVIESSIHEVRKDGYEMLRSVSRRHSQAHGITGFLAGGEIGTFRVRRGAALADRELRQGVLRSASGATVLAIKRGDELVTNPDPIWQLQEDDIVLLLGTPEQMASAAPLFSPAKNGGKAG